MRVKWVLLAFHTPCMVLSGLSALEPFRARGEQALSILEFTLSSRNLKDVLWLANPNERNGKLLGLNARGRAILVSNTLRTIQLGAFITVD